MKFSTKDLFNTINNDSSPFSFTELDPRINYGKSTKPDAKEMFQRFYEFNAATLKQSSTISSTVDQALLWFFSYRRNNQT